MSEYTDKIAKSCALDTLMDRVKRAEMERIIAEKTEYNSAERFNAQGSCNEAEGYALALLELNIIPIHQYNFIHHKIWNS